MFEKFDFSATKDDLLVIVDMQKDFVTGVLGTPEAQAIVTNIKEFLCKFQGRVAFTKDTHSTGYLNTQEGRKLPVEHCLKDTPGWEIIPELSLSELLIKMATTQPIEFFEKTGFGSPELMDFIRLKKFKRIFFCGVCTEFCVISNAVGAKAFDTEVEIIILAPCCAGATIDGHNTALKTMATLQMTVYQNSEV